MNSTHANSAGNSLSRAFQLREAVLLLFCDPLRMEYARLLHLSRKDWKDLLRWLDTSGLALYFLDRAEELGLVETLPWPVIARLRQNLADNTERMDEMIAESIAIQRRFQDAGLTYAMLKGFSLWPISVPKLELRSQLDLDFLVAEESAIEARRILEDAGYRLRAVSGGSWEFKANEGRPPSLNGLYKAGLTRSVELHLETVSRSRPSRLSRSQSLRFHGLLMPVLSPVDLFLGQALHLYKHVCSEFSRTAHLIEFRRHVIARYGDDAFWTRLEQQSSSESGTYLRLGAVIHLISNAMGQFAPGALTRWSVDRLPPGVGRWIDLYGRRTVLMSFPGSKLYLLLQEEMEAAGLPAKRPLRQALLPRRLPPAISHAVALEGFSGRTRRYYREVHFIFFRLRFHLMEGLRYLIESILWRQSRNEFSQ
jgi:hypothetical protein